MNVYIDLCSIGAPSPFVRYSVKVEYIEMIESVVDELNDDKSEMP